MAQSKEKRDEWKLICFLRFSFVEDNLFGWNQNLHDLDETESPTIVEIAEKPFDPRTFRPLSVSLRVALHKITGQLIHVGFSVKKIIFVVFVRWKLFSYRSVFRKRSVSDRFFWTFVRRDDDERRRNPSSSCFCTDSNFRRRFCYGKVKTNETK